MGYVYRLLSLLLLISSTTLAQDLSDATYMKIGDDWSIVYPLPDDVSVERNFRLAMDDGVEVSMNIYRPKTDEKVPVIMAFTSYNKNMGPNLYLTFTRGHPFRQLGVNLGSMKVSSEAPFEGPDPGFWVPHGYAVIVVDARGTGDSGGKNDPFSRRVHKDFAAVVEWASEQPWTNGKIGTQGTSYLGITQWYVAALRPKGLVAINVWEGLTSIKRDAAFHGGIPETGFVPWWMAGHGAGIDPNAVPQFGVTDLPKVPTMKFYTDFEIPSLDVSKIEVPALVTSTWSNQGLHSRGGFEGYKQLTTEKFLYTHGGHEWTVSNSDETREYQKAFFDYYLKGDSSARDRLMKVRLEIRKGGEEFYVREEKGWPIPGTEYRKLYLDGFDRTLAEEVVDRKTIAQYASTMETDQVTFRHTFDRDTEIAGYSKLKLWVSTSHGNDLDLFVGIRKIGKDGEIEQFWNALDWHDIASRGWLRVSMRKLDGTLATDIQPVLSLDEYQPVKPNEIVPVEIEILPFAVLFEEGSTLELIVKGSDIPESLIYQHMKLVNQGYHSIYAGKEHDSHLVLPVLN